MEGEATQLYFKKLLFRTIFVRKNFGEHSSVGQEKYQRKTSDLFSGNTTTLFDYKIIMIRNCQFSFKIII